MSEWGVVANVANADSCLRLGAKVTLVWWSGNPDRAKWNGLSRGGRRIYKWLTRKRLKNFRAKWLQPGARHNASTYGSREEAAREAAYLAGDRLEPPNA